MKKSLTILSLLFCFISTEAQLDSNFFEVGLNSIRLLQVNRSSSQIPSDYWSPYILTLEKKFGRIGVRAGFGISSSTDTELPTALNGNAEFRNDTSSFDGRLGLVVYAALSDKWSLKYGVDGILSNSKREYNSIIQLIDGNTVENIHTTKRAESGVNGFVFPQYHLSKRVSIGTELGITYTSIKTTKTVKADNFPQFDSKLENQGTSFNIHPPSALFIIVRF